MKTVFMFSGQGSQYFQMGRPLYERNPVFRQELLRLDSVAKDLIGQSVVDAMFDASRSKSDLFNRTLLTSPAILMTELALFKVLSEAQLTPDIVLAASLGTYAAAVAGGAMNAEAALASVVAHSKHLEEKCRVGGMIAVLADQDVLRCPELADVCELAASNFPGHFVVAVAGEHVARVEKFLSSQGHAFQNLPVSFAFHSRWIEEVREFTQQPRINALSVPLACCALVETLSRIPNDYFWRVMREPIRFDRLIAKLETSEAHRYVDLGPSGTLATFVKYLLPQDAASRIHRILSPLGAEERFLAQLVGQRATPISIPR